MNEPSSSAAALAARYGAPARRAAPVPEHLNLSQITARSETEYPTQSVAPGDTVVEHVTTYLTASEDVNTTDAPAREDSFQAPIRPSDSEGSREGPQDSESQIHEAIELRTACLVDLTEASEKLFDQIFSRKSTKSAALWEKLLQVKRQNFSGLREIYADPGEDFIDLQKVCKMVKPGILPQARGVVVLANLVRFLDQWSSSKEIGFLEDQLKLLDNTQFPVPFSPLNVSEGLKETDVEQALGIRTQRFIVALENSHDSKAVSTKQKIADWVTSFFSEEASNRRLVAEEMSSICGIDYPMPDDAAEKCLQRAQVIIEKADGSTVAEVAASLRKAYPLEDWRASLIDWGYAQFRDVQSTLANPDSEEDTQASRSPSQAPSESGQSIIRPTIPAKAPNINRNIVAFLFGKGPDSSRRQADSAPPPGLDEEDEQSARPPLDDDQYNKLMADRVAARFKGPQGKQALPAPSSIGLNPASSRKRTHEQSDADEDGDEDEDEFEQDARQPDDKRRAELDRQAMPPPSKRRAPLPSAPPSGQPPVPEAQESEEEEDPFAATPPRPQPVVEIDFRAISQKNRRRLNPQGERGQRRIPWSNSDTKKLIKYIAEFHCSWAKIYNAANVVEVPNKPIPEYNPNKHFENARDQQAIRDKARNLKVDFLKADLVLPSDFDGIILSKKERDAVLARGKNPDRSENDVDDDGNPTNTVWLDEQLSSE